MKRSILLIIAVFIPALMIIFVARGRKEAPVLATPAVSVPVQTAVPIVERFRLQDLSGRERVWSEFFGKPLVINFWASWCGPCRHEIPILNELYKEFHPRGLEIVGISVDEKKDAARSFVEQFQIPWVIVFNDGKADREFSIGQGIPVTIFLDAQGKEIYRIIGARPEEVFRKGFEKLFPG